MKNAFTVRTTHLSYFYIDNLILQFGSVCMCVYRVYGIELAVYNCSTPSCWQPLVSRLGPRLWRPCVREPLFLSISAGSRFRTNAYGTTGGYRLARVGTAAASPIIMVHTNCTNADGGCCGYWRHGSLLGQCTGQHWHVPLYATTLANTHTHTHTKRTRTRVHTLTRYVLNT